MTDLQKINFSIQLIIILEKAKNQQDLGLKLGYADKSSFSTAIKKPTIKFINKLRSFDENVNKLWQNNFKYILNPEDDKREIKYTDEELIDELRRRLNKTNQ